MLKSSNKLAKTAKYLDKAYDTSKALKRIKNSRKALETPAEVNKRKRQLAKVATENKVKELTKGLEKLTSSKGRKFTQEATEQLSKKTFNVSEGFKSFNAFKKSAGSAGTGKEWHHIVEQSQAKITRSGFDIRSINHPDNMVAIDKDVHHRISAYYSSKPDFTKGLTFRDYLNGRSFEEQYQWGLKVLDDAINGVI